MFQGLHKDLGANTEGAFFLSSVRFHMKISPPPPSAVVLPHIGPADFQFDPGSHMNVIKGKKKLLLAEPSGSVMNKFRLSHVITVLLTPMHTPFQILKLRQPQYHARYHFLWWLLVLGKGPSNL